MSNTGLFVFAGMTLLLLSLFWIMRLTTEIDGKGIRARFVPFANREVSWSEIKSIEVIEYGFVGGWGMRMGTKYGTV